MTLFDLYRATGQVERFESAAIDFAGRFGRSAPAWFSIADAATGAEAPAAPQPPGTVEAAHWQASGSVGLQSVAALSAALMRAPQPWRLDWNAMAGIEVPALEPLCRIFAEWAAQPVQLRFMGVEALDRVLKAATPSNDKRVNPNWWRLRMEALRVMHRPDEFELVALDYCVTYEVSPPSWESAHCDFRVIQADGSTAAASKFMEASFRDSGASSGQAGYAETQMPAQSQLTSHSARAELAGQVLGDASEALDIIEVRLTGADVMTISCARLVRIDFSAAGTLLNWVTSRQAEGRQVQFVGVHRLIAAFFNVIGISEHARIIPRVD
ncbi:MAG: STAS domain-containing protein, partial [Burkholderiaceae bacterium]|nr:STAS domain-containing protein [Burkholderiaceae bacterium]